MRFTCASCGLDGGVEVGVARGVDASSFETGSLGLCCFDEVTSLGCPTIPVVAGGEVEFGLPECAVRLRGLPTDEAVDGAPLVIPATVTV